ncbi:30S ribosomal protein S20 [Candidatus Karelsulcia muelleri]
MGSHKTKIKKYLFKTTKTAIKKNKSVKDKKRAQIKFSLTSSLIDKLSQKQIIPKNKANRLKRKIQIYINKLP